MPRSFAKSHRTTSRTSLTLLERVRANDEDSWHRLVALYRPLVTYWCGRWSINPADVDDVIQDVFTVVSEKIHAFRHDKPGGSFRGWLWGITRNKLLEYSRKDASRISADGGSHALRRLENLPDKTANEILDEPAQQISQLYLRAILLVKEEFTARTWLLFWRIAVDGE